MFDQTLDIKLFALTLLFSGTIARTIELLIGEKKPLKKEIKDNKTKISINMTVDSS
jgi:hypothetical protein